MVEVAVAVGGGVAMGGLGGRVGAGRVGGV